MNREERRAARAKARKAGKVTLGPGALMLPIAGTVHYDKHGAVGVWGRDMPLRYMLLEDDTSRELTRQEAALARRIYGDPNA